MDTEKPKAAHAEQIPTLPIGDIDLDSMDPADYAAKEKLLVRKIDIRLMPCLVLMIILKFVNCFNTLQPSFLAHEVPKIIQICRLRVLSFLLIL